MADNAPYNPLDIMNLGESIERAILARPVLPLGALQSFVGAGMYMLYYSGDFQQYQPLAIRNQDQRFEAPIYIGEAVNPGSSTGLDLDATNAGAPLFDRLNQHRASIAYATSTLRIEDFHCRYLVTHDVWIPLGETVLIRRFKPLWNRHVRGFGNKNPGGKRLASRKPEWDTIHPGRPWAETMPPNTKTRVELLENVHRALTGLPAAPLSAEEQRDELRSDETE